jgi:hypothetical protein
VKELSVIFWEVAEFMSHAAIEAQLGKVLVVSRPILEALRWRLFWWAVETLWESFPSVSWEAWEERTRSTKKMADTFSLKNQTRGCILKICTKSIVIGVPSFDLSFFSNKLELTTPNQVRDLPFAFHRKNSRK